MILLAYGLLLLTLLGLGTLAASFLPTRGARIGLGAVLCLAVIIDGTWLLAPILDWSAGLVDSVWIVVFAAVSIGAAMTASYYRGTTGQPSWTWPSRRDLLFLLVVIVLFGAVIALLPVPLDTDAQGFGYLALMLREGEDYTTLAPWYPEIEFLYSPAYFGALAHLSAHFDPGLHELMLVFGAVTAVLFVWTAYDLGCELEGPRTGRAFMLAALGGTGLLTAFMDSHYTAVLGLAFSLAFLTFVLRFLHTHHWPNAVAAAICLAGVPLSQPDTTIALMIGYVPWLLVIAFAKPRPSLGTWLVVAVVIPLLALILVAPWLISIEHLLGADIESPFEVAMSHWRTLVFMHGGVIVLLSALGLLLDLRKRSPATLLAVVWLVGIVEFSTLGLLEQALPGLVEPLLKYDYPFSLAWHGPIIPYILLGGPALVWLADRLHADRLVRALAMPVLILALIVIGAGVLYFDPLLEASKDSPVNFFGAFASEADVAAMEWLRDHTAEDTRILNHPGPQEGDWVPVIGERATVFFRPQPFFQGTESVEAEQAVFRDFWRDPANPEYAGLLFTAEIDYVIVPQVFGNPAAFEDMLRWREPIPEAASYNAAAFADLDYLQLVFARDGARVYAVTLGAAAEN